MDEIDFSPLWVSLDIQRRNKHLHETTNSAAVAVNLLIHRAVAFEGEMTNKNGRKQNTKVDCQNEIPRRWGDESTRYITARMKCYFRSDSSASVEIKKNKSEAHLSFFSFVLCATGLRKICSSVSWESLIWTFWKQSKEKQACSFSPPPWMNQREGFAPDLSSGCSSVHSSLPRPLCSASWPVQETHKVRRKSKGIVKHPRAG